MKKMNILSKLEIADTEEIRNTTEATDDDHDAIWIPIGMSLGSALGTSLGLLFNNISLGMCLGTSLGLLVGTLIYVIKSKEEQ